MTIGRRLVSAAMTVAVVASTSCSTKETPPGASAALATASIGPEGGTLASPGGEVVLEIPAGALDRRVDLVLRTPASPPAGSVVGAWEIEPSGTTFTRPATLSLRTGANAASDTKVLRLAVEAGGSWQPLASGAWVAEERVVVGRLAHLSTYGVLAVDRPETRGSDCACAPEVGTQCCARSRGDYLARCDCAHSYTAETIHQRHSDSWTWLDCMTEHEAFRPTAHGVCVLDCCRKGPGVAIFSDGNDVVCELERGAKGFVACVDACPRAEAPPCRTGNPDADAGNAHTDAGAGDAAPESGVGCGAATCPQGCCDPDGRCVAGDTASLCGRGGAACTDCGSNACTRPIGDPNPCSQCIDTAGSTWTGTINGASANAGINVSSCGLVNVSLSGGSVLVGAPGALSGTSFQGSANVCPNGSNDAACCTLTFSGSGGRATAFTGTCKYTPVAGCDGAPTCTLNVSMTRP